ncbi:DUF6088 family protein [Melittangium boletus]|uniref:Transcriptional regulator, AbiEi antitoxin, Type IV TA system n=1 Tax=Melittangium boletus DSM 14713 TaxID=1294270 RepID=A0A250ID69_9BACT|nr:DUF6088 family protein [Melittangium boletus]ATB29715.1 hypothetical protein MEBOL_003170 [Melittangium boletus DSM 14713]
MAALAESIMKRAAALSEGTPLFAKEFLHLGSRAAVDQALSRLHRSGRLLRPERGVYVRPVETRFGVRPPSVSKVVEALASAKGKHIAPQGAASANALGMTTQVPVRTVYLTTGRSRRLTLGTQEVELRHASSWQVALPHRPAGQVIRALAWLGKEEGPKKLSSLRGKLSEGELQELAAMSGQLPTWMAEQIGALVHD